MGKPFNILLAEDSDDHAFLANYYLKKNKRVGEIIHFTSPKKALEFLASPSHSPKIDIAILDLKLPEIGGFELIEKIREANPKEDLKFFVLSSSTSSIDMDRAQELSVKYLVKPMQDDHVNQIIDELDNNL